MSEEAIVHSPDDIPVTSGYIPISSDKRIYNFLKASRNMESNISIMRKKLQLSRSTLVRRLDVLRQQGLVHKGPGKGNGYIYRAVTDSNIRVPKYVNPPKANYVPLPQGFQVDEIDIPPGSLDSFAAKWSQDKWEPKIFETARYLPLAIGRLYELAAETAYGATIPKEHLDSVKQDVALFLKAIESTYATVGSILARPELWDPKRFAQHIMHAGKDPNYYQGIAYNIKEKN